MPALASLASSRLTGQPIGAAAARDPTGARPAVLDDLLTAEDRSVGQMVRDMAAGDPFMEGILRSRLGRRLGIDIRTPEEEQLIARELALKEQALQREERRALTTNVVGFLVDNAQSDAGQAMGQFAERFGFAVDPTALETLQGMTLTDMVNQAGVPGLLDATLLQEPERLTAATSVLGRLFDTPALQVQFSDLLEFDLTKEMAQKTVEQRGAERVQEQERAARAEESLAQREEQFLSGEGAVSDQLTAALEAAEDPEGFDFTGFSTMFGDDFDSEGGAQRVLGAIEGFYLGRVQSGADRGRAATTLLQSGQLESLRENLARNVAADDQGNVAPASALGAMYLDFVRRLGRASGIGAGRALEAAGLKDVRGISDAALDAVIAETGLNRAGG